MIGRSGDRKNSHIHPVSRTPEAVPLTEAQCEELDQRMDELDREGPVGIPWDEVRDRIRGRAQ